jgi:hypothetical protein
MKTNISIPNAIYEQAEQLAQTLGMSLSELYAAALAAYVAAHRRTEVTKALNRAYETEPSAIEPELVEPFARDEIYARPK